jgi:putative acetyltransferase
VTPYRLRPEEGGDADDIRAIHVAAFPTPAESRLVDALRAAGRSVVTLVAESEGRIAGHVLLTPVAVEGTANRGLGLAPLAVLPGQQRQGLGSALVRAGLARAAALGFDFVVVLGEPEYYRRFGFVTASRTGLGNEYGVDEPFMALALKPNGLAGVAGPVRYAPEFALVSS